MRYCTGVTCLEVVLTYYTDGGALRAMIVLLLLRIRWKFDRIVLYRVVHVWSTCFLPGWFLLQIFIIGRCCYHSITML